MLADDVALELPRLRAEAEARMTSRVTIRRKTGKTTQNEGNGRVVPVWTVLYINLPFRLGGADSGDSASRTQTIGGVEVQTAVRIGHMPAATAGLQDGDWLDVTAGENTGTAWQVVEATFQDQATARRVPLLAQNRPEEWP